jgi:hypothetical protein
MKLRVLLVAALSAGLAASAAVAGPPLDKGKKPPTTGEGCKPMVTVVLKGTVKNATSANLTMDVTRSNRWGRAYVTTTTTVEVDTEKTKVRRNGKKTIVALEDGDRVLVQARACKADLADGATPELTAARIVAHPTKQNA